MMDLPSPTATCISARALNKTLKDIIIKSKTLRGRARALHPGLGLSRVAH